MVFELLTWWVFRLTFFLAQMVGLSVQKLWSFDCPGAAGTSASVQQETGGALLRSEVRSVAVHRRARGSRIRWSIPVKWTIKQTIWKHWRISWSIINWFEQKMDGMIFNGLPKNPIFSPGETMWDFYSKYLNSGFSECLAAMQERGSLEKLHLFVFLDLDLDHTQMIPNVWRCAVLGFKNEACLFRNRYTWFPKHFFFSLFLVFVFFLLFFV